MEEKKKAEYVFIKNTIIKLSSVRYFKFNYSKLTIKVCLLNYRKLKFKFKTDYDYDRAKETILHDTVPILVNSSRVWWSV